VGVHTALSCNVDRDRLNYMIHEHQLGDSTIDVHCFGIIKIFSSMVRSPKVHRRTLAARGPRKVVSDASPRTIKYF
jgi:hypothetical protein